MGADTTFDICKSEKAINVAREAGYSVEQVFGADSAYIPRSLTRCIENEFVEGFEVILKNKDLNLPNNSSLSMSYLLRQFIYKKDVDTEVYLSLLLKYEACDLTSDIAKSMKSKHAPKSAKLWLLKNLESFSIEQLTGIDLSDISLDINTFHEIASKNWAKHAFACRVSTDLLTLIKKELFPSCKINLGNTVYMKTLASKWDNETFDNIDLYHENNLEFYLSLFPKDAKREVTMKRILERMRQCNERYNIRVFRCLQSLLHFTKDDVVFNITELIKLSNLSSVAWLISETGVKEEDLDYNACKAASNSTCFESWWDHTFHVPTFVKEVDSSSTAYTQDFNTAEGALMWLRSAVAAGSLEAVKWIMEHSLLVLNDTAVSKVVTRVLANGNLDMLKVLYDHYDNRSCFVHLQYVRTEDVLHWLNDKYKLTVEDVKGNSFPMNITTALLEMNLIQPENICLDLKGLIECKDRDKRLRYLSALKKTLDRETFFTKVDLLKLVDKESILVEAIDDIYGLNEKQIRSVAQHCMATGQLYWVLQRWTLFAWELLNPVIHPKAAHVLRRYNETDYNQVQNLHYHLGALGWSEGCDPKAFVMDIVKGVVIFEPTGVIQDMLLWVLNKYDMEATDELRNDILKHARNDWKTLIAVTLGGDTFAVLKSKLEAHAFTVREHTNFADVVAFYNDYARYKKFLDGGGEKDNQLEEKLLSTFDSIVDC